MGDLGMVFFIFVFLLIVSAMCKSLLACIGLFPEIFIVPWTYSVDA